MQDVRERLVLALLLEMGLRPREVFALTFQALQPGALSVLGKDGRVRTMSIGKETQQALDRYLAALLVARQQGDAALSGWMRQDLLRWCGHWAGVRAWIVR